MHWLRRNVDMSALDCCRRCALEKSMPTEFQGSTPGVLGRRTSGQILYGSRYYRAPEHFALALMALP